MKRSEINGLLLASIDFLGERGVSLPPQATWDLNEWYAQWQDNKEGIEGLAERGIGWDITDFGSGKFRRRGLILYTFSNGILSSDGLPVDQPYANKLLIVGEKQVTPMHHHWHKMEDIINHGGGVLQIELYNRTGGSKVNKNSDPVIMRNGILVHYKAGTVIELEAGERVRLDTIHYHKFWGKEGRGTVLVEEVSMVNDDKTDNHFLPRDRVGRFPTIVENEPPLYLLCTELPGTKKFDKFIETYGLKE